MENINGFRAVQITDSLVADVNEVDRGKCLTLESQYGARIARTKKVNATVHDANFAFLSTTLAKLHKTLYEPLSNVTWQEDVDFDMGGGFVDFVEFYSVSWAGIMNEFRNIVGNNGNYIPRVNAGLNQNRVNVYTYEVAYDLRFIELEKMKKVTLQKSIQDIYSNIITTSWDLFVQSIVYTGINGSHGLFNHDNVMSTLIANSSSAAGKGFKSDTDATIVAFFNGVFNAYLSNSNMNFQIVPDTFLVPTFVTADLISRMNSLYTNTLLEFIKEHNIASALTAKDVKIRIMPRKDLDTLGANSKGRIVAYKKDKRFVRIDIPYPMQHYITQPNIERGSYTTLFAGQVSEIQLPYNTSSAEQGIVSYWDFTY